MEGKHSIIKYPDSASLQKQQQHALPGEGIQRALGLLAHPMSTLISLYPKVTTCPSYQTAREGAARSSRLLSSSETSDDLPAGRDPSPTWHLPQLLAMSPLYLPPSGRPPPLPNPYRLPCTHLLPTATRDLAYSL